MKICFATNNPNKLLEIRSAIGDAHEIVSLAAIGCDQELPENQTTLEGNSLEKAQYVFDQYGIPCFADDTGLEIDALKGAPGVYSARYAGEPSDSLKNMDKVLTNLAHTTNRKARFRTVITFISGLETTQFEGDVKGTIREEKSGQGGFGYDPIFQPEGYTVTFSEMEMSEKNKISHRGLAVQKFIQHLKSI